LGHRPLDGYGLHERFRLQLACRDPRPVATSGNRSASGADVARRPRTALRSGNAWIALGPVAAGPYGELPTNHLQLTLAGQARSSRPHNQSYRTLQRTAGRMESA